MGIYFAAQPKDVEHPYGHAKFETLASIVIAILLFVVAINVFYEGVLKILHPSPARIDIDSFIVMGGTLITNIFVTKYEYKRGRELSSDILISDSYHTRSDIMVTSSVILTLILIKFGLHFLDAPVSLGISGFIAYAGWTVLRRGSRVLCDAIVIDPEVISNIAKSVLGVVNVHKIRTRGLINEFTVDLHVTVNRNITVEEGHEIASQIQKRIQEQIPGVFDVLVHIEPFTEQEVPDT